MDCTPQSSSVHGILQARILEWVAISFSRGSSQPRDQTQVSRTAGRFFTIWTTREAHSWLRGQLKWVKQHQADKGKLFWSQRPNFLLQPKEIVSVGYFIYPKAFLYNYFSLAQIEEAAHVAQW